jgi:hypothetical protein
VKGCSPWALKISFINDIIDYEPQSEKRITEKLSFLAVWLNKRKALVN